jgi:exodeoxyribonuclease VII large subunit
MADAAPRREPAHVFTVSALTGAVRDLLQGTFGDVWVKGEISQWRPSPAGHVYFTLKDEGAVLPCVLWRSQAARQSIKPSEGLEVLVGGGLDVYPPHGRYQLQVRTLEPLGAGALQQAFERLRKRLDAEGLFAPEHKVPLPPLPRRIALVTSPTGAAVRDLVTVIRRRYPNVTLLLVPVRVQGAGAAEEIARGIAFADRAAEADVIVAGRGGGSLEDLWAFNEEVVARAIFACRTPLVSAVGHEVDVSIADLVADVRAATPSQAGELVVPVKAELVARVDEERRRLDQRLRVRVDRAWQRLEALCDRPALRSPAALLRPRRLRLEHLRERLKALSPAAALRRRRERLDDLARRAQQAIARALLAPRARLGSAEASLRALSPLAVLARGWSLTTANGRVVRAATDVAVGDALETRLADGARLTSRVEGIAPARRTEGA